MLNTKENLLSGLNYLNNYIVFVNKKNYNFDGISSV